MDCHFLVLIMLLLMRSFSGSLPISIIHFKAYGCLSFVSTLKQYRTQFQPRANACVFLGYSCTQKGYKVYDLTSHKILVSRYVIFHEQLFPYHFKDKSQSPFPQFYLPIITHLPTLFDPPTNPTSAPVSTLPHNNMCPPTLPSPHTSSPPTDSNPPSLRKSQRLHRPLSHLQDFVCNSSTTH